MLAIGMSAFAGGSSETTEAVPDVSTAPQYVQDIVMQKVEPQTAVGGVMTRIANMFDTVTILFCTSLSPFPNSIASFYSETSLANDVYTYGISTTGKTPDNSLLISRNYYEQNSPIINVGDSREVRGISSASQQKTWNMITVLFVSFFAAEVLFSAFYGYMTDRDGGILKEVISKAVLAILLFLLLSAMPFLIEAFRYGFLLMARTLTGLDDFETSNDDEKYMLSMMQEATVFQYPGLLVRNLGHLIDNLNPNNVGGINLYDEVIDGFFKPLVEVLFNIVYMFVKFICCILIVFAAFHVMINVCEVYLLLGIAMCITPFIVFSPLKFLGEKALMSLFSNMMELFVIVVILFSTFTIGVTVEQITLESLYQGYKSASYTISGVTKARLEGLTGKTIRTGLAEAESEEEINIIFNDKTTEIDTSVTLTQLEKTYVDSVRDYINERFRELLEAGELNLSAWVNTVGDLSYEKRASELEKLEFSDLPTGDKLEVMDILQSNFSNFGMTLQQKALEPAVRDDGYDTIFIHLFLTFLCVFMQVFFVNQSNQITNALLSGNVASEGISAAMGKFLAGHVAGKTVGGVANAGSRLLFGNPKDDKSHGILGGTARGVGAGFGAAVGSGAGSLASRLGPGKTQQVMSGISNMFNSGASGKIREKARNARRRSQEKWTL